MPTHHPLVQFNNPLRHLLHCHPSTTIARMVRSVLQPAAEVLQNTAIYFGWSILTSLGPLPCIPPGNTLLMMYTLQTYHHYFYHLLRNNVFFIVSDLDSFLNDSLRSTLQPEVCQQPYKPCTALLCMDCLFYAESLLCQLSSSIAQICSNSIIILPFLIYIFISYVKANFDFWNCENIFNIFKYSAFHQWVHELIILMLLIFFCWWSKYIFTSPILTSI